MGQRADIIHKQVNLAINFQILVQDKELLVFYDTKAAPGFGMGGLEILLGNRDIEFFQQLDKFPV
jgi:hypothetical protein